MVFDPEEAERILAARPNAIARGGGNVSSASNS